MIDFPPGFKKYAKKEFKKQIDVVAIQITNNSQRDLTFGKDVKLTKYDGQELLIINNNQVHSSLKQGVPIYLLYLLFRYCFQLSSYKYISYIELISYVSKNNLAATLFHYH